MKVNEVLKESAEVAKTMLDDIKGKTFSYAELLDYLKKQDALENPYPNKTIFKLKKDAGFTMARLLTALKKAGDKTVWVRKYRTNEIMIDYDLDVPVEGVIMFDQTADKEEASEQWKKAKSSAKGTAGGKGWFCKSGGMARSQLVGKFLTGPYKDDWFVTDYFEGKDIWKKKGDKVKVLIHGGETVYGNVSIVK